MKNLIKSPFSMSVGMIITAGFAASSVQADSNPFKLTELSQSSIQLARLVPAEESKVAPAAKSGDAPAEMKCGAMMKDKSEDQMSSMKGSGEMACGAMMKKMSGMSSEEKKAMCMKMRTDEKQSHE